MASPTTKERLVSLDAFRGLSILLIVMTHVYSSVLPDWYYYLVQNASVFFIFISGFFFSYLHKPAESVLSFWKRKATRIVIPYLVSAVVGIIIHGRLTQGLPDASYLVQTILTGAGHQNVAHWYIPFICLVFLLYPLLVRLLLQPRLLQVSAVLWLVLGMFTFRSVDNALPWVSFIHFFGVFLAGMLASSHHEWLFAFCRSYVIPIVVLGLAASWLMLQLIGQHWFFTMEFVWANQLLVLDFTYIAKLIQILPLLAIFEGLLMCGFRFHWLRTLAAMSFGMFYWHAYLILFLNLIVSLWFPADSFPAFLVHLGFVLVGCLLFLLAIRRAFPKYSNWITGY